MKNSEVEASFGPHLRRLREERSMSQQELADEADIAKKTIQRIEMGRHSPTLHTLVLLADALRIDLVTLFSMRK